MKFKLFLESSNIIVSQMNSDGREFTIVYPSGIYRYHTEFGPIVISLYRKYSKAPGRFVNKIKELVNSGKISSRKVS